VLRMGLERLAGAIQPMEPPTGSAVPHYLQEVTQAVEGGIVEPLVAGVPPAGFRSRQGLSGLEFQELFMAAAGGPSAIEIAEKAAVSKVHATRKPRVEHMPLQDAFELLDAKHAR
jgi:hypothetical protein